MDSEMVRLSEAAKQRGCSPDTLRRYVIAGLLPAIRTPGGMYLVKLDDVGRLFSPVAAGQGAK